MTQDDRIRAAQERLERGAADTTPRNTGFNLTKGHLYRIRSRNLSYGVYDGNGGFIGIREKFGALYLFTEYDYDQGAPYGTVRVVEDLGPVPEGVEPVEWLGQGEERDDNMALYRFLSAAEQEHGRGEGYGDRPGDELGGDDETV